MIIWMTGKSLMTHHCPKKNNFILTQTCTIFSDYMQVEKIRKDFEIINLGEYHDLYFKSDTLLLADVF